MRPLIPVKILGPTGLFRDFPQAVVDTGADDTVFPINMVPSLGHKLLPFSGQGIRWRGQLHALRFGAAEPEIAANGMVWRWLAIVGLTPAPIRYPILGQAGFRQFMDARFLGADLAVELESNRTYPGTQT